MRCRDRVFVVVVCSLLCWVPWPCCSATLEIGGTIETYGAVYFNSEPGVEDRYGEIRFRPTMRYAPTDTVLFYLEGDLRGDSEGFARGTMDGFPDRGGRRRIADLREGYADWKWNWLGIRVGQQIFDWSVTDTVSPCDNLNPRDWTDVVEFEKTGVPALYLRAGYNAFVELVYVPWFSPSDLPVIGSRWERELPPGLINGEQDVLGRNHGQVAVRAGATLKGIDFGAVYYRGYGYSPSFRLSPISPVAVELVPVYRFEEVYSGYASRAIGSFNLRGEVGYFRQENEDNFIQYVFGIDREWSGLIRPVDSLHVLIEYANEIVTQRDNPVGLPTIDFRRVLTDCVMLKVDYSFDSEKRWCIKLEGAYNLSDKDSFIEPAIVWRRKSFELEAGIDILSGARNTFFGGYGHNDRFYSKATFKF